MLKAKKGTKIEFNYVNWQGVKGHRRVEVQNIGFGATKYHPEAMWLLEAFDLDKEADRVFAMKDMTDVEIINEK